MRKARAACLFALAGALASEVAGAQQAPQQSSEAAHKYKPQPLNLRREQSGTGVVGDQARAKMRSGDWAGALEIFDVALRTSTDPALRRDRGLCHERLGHAYPAIDDFRAYLTAAPEAADAEEIRQHLANLEQSTLGYSSASSDAPGDVEGGASASASVRAGKTSVSASTTLQGNKRDTMDYVEREDDPLQTPLRRGKGYGLAPFFSEHKWGVSPARLALNNYSNAGSSFGDGSTWAECVGLEFRYSFGPASALVVEAGYEHFNSTGVDVAVVSGLTSQVAYEWRFPLDAEYGNQLILAPGLGYEHLVVQPGDAQNSTTSMGGFVPRLRFGWRHLLAASAALGVSLDGGVVNFFTYSDFPYYPRGDATSALVALDIDILWGL
jgi:tetratricopeptide repeat protein